MVGQDAEQRSPIMREHSFHLKRAGHARHCNLIVYHLLQ